MKLRGVISLRKLLPTCAIPNGTLTRVLSQDVLEVNEDALRGFGPQERAVGLTAERSDRGREHQIKVAGWGQRTQIFGVGTDDLFEVFQLREVNSLSSNLS